MAKTAKATALEIDRDTAFHRREWRIQRIGWLAMLATLLAGLLGLFGGGPLAHATARAGGVPVSLDYDRFIRFGSPNELRLTLDPSAIGGDGAARLWLPHRYLDRVEIDRITPEPENTSGGATGVMYEFLVTPGQPAVISMMVKAEHAGPLQGEVLLPDRRGVTFSQFVYP